MTEVFRIISDERAGPLPAAQITPDQLRDFRSYLRREGARLGLSLLGPHHPDEGAICFGFDARVCPLSLAAVTRIFDNDEAVISIIEEAQFRGRRVCVARDDDHPAITLRVSDVPDCDAEQTVPDHAADGLLGALGIAPDREEIPRPNRDGRLARI